MENIKLFKWHWEDEPNKDELELIIARTNEVGRIEYCEGEFIQKNYDGREFIDKENDFLKSRFIGRYNIIDATDIYSFLNYQYNAYRGEKKDFLNYSKAVILTMPQTNPFEGNFEGKRQIGLDWVEEKINELRKDSITKRKSNRQNLPAADKACTFDNVFRKKISSENFIKRLKLKEYINEENEWLRKKSDFIGLLCFLIEEDYSFEKRKRPLYRILLEKITIDRISKVDKMVNAHYYEQYFNVFNN